MPKAKAPSKSPPFDLAYWFVTVYLGRQWGEDDDKGMHLKHAKEAIDNYGMATVVHCLEAYRAGRLGDNKFQLKTILGIRGGEPPIIARYKALATTPPPVYKKTAYAAWQAEFHPEAATQPQESQPCLSPRLPPSTLPSSVRLHTGRRPNWPPSTSTPTG